ncbi:MAG: FKBP-type peptidyl-prolyl cis-trans isomerase [Polaribacter sp.]
MLLSTVDGTNIKNNINTNKMKQFILFLFIACLSSSCSDKYDAEEQHADDITAIENYLTANNLDYSITAGGVYYYIEEEGNNDGSPTIDNTVVCNYIGFFFDRLAEDGIVSIFDGTTDTPATFPLQNVIKGWQEGIPKMSRNATGRFYIPSTLAYGNQGSRDIGRNEILVFDIGLVHFY